MAKKSVGLGLKSEELIDLIEHDDRVINAIMLRIEHSLTQTIERVFDKLALSLTQRVDEMVEHRLQQHSADQNRITSGLEKENQMLRSKVDDLETYMKLDNLIIHGLEVSTTSEDNDETPTLTPTQAVLKLFNERLEVPITDRDLVKVHHISTKGASPRKPILVKFSSRGTRDLVLLARKKLKSQSAETSRIYINEHLTQVNATIFAETRKMVKNKSIYATWSRNGRIFYKRSDNESEKPTRVDALKDLAFI